MKEQITTFNTLSIDEDIVQAMHDLGYQKPTPIQALSIPKLMQGHDLIGLSQTGTGKTVAFAIPLIELIDPDDRRLQAVVLCPTVSFASKLQKKSASFSNTNREFVPWRSMAVSPSISKSTP